MDQDVTHPAGSKCHPSIRLHMRGLGSSATGACDYRRKRPPQVPRQINAGEAARRPASRPLTEMSTSQRLPMQPTVTDAAGLGLLATGAQQAREPGEQNPDDASIG